MRTSISPTLSTIVLTCCGLLVVGCGKARPKVVVATSAGATSSGPASPHAFPGARTALPNAGVPGSTAPPASGSVTPPTSGSVAPPTTATTPAPQASVGGLSAPPATALPAPTTTITIGAGPVIGRTARGDVREHTRDWEARDVRALDPLDVRFSGDGLTASRELLAFYSRRQAGRLLMRVDLLDLGFGAELGGLDLVVLIGWAGAGAPGALPLGLQETTTVPFGAALIVKDTTDYELRDGAGIARVTSAQGGIDLSFRSDLDTVELGLDEAHLRARGWTGQALTFQVLSVQDGRGRVADAILENDVRDRVLSEYVREGWVAARRAIVAPIAVGNRAALDATYLRSLVHSTQTTTREGFPTGLRRTLESHHAHKLPLSVHLQGVLANAIGWASSSDPNEDGPAFLARLAEFFDGQPANGEADFLPGLYVDNMMPYFAGVPNQRFIARAAEVARVRLGVTAPGPVFWVPERVMKGSTFADITAAGFTHTVLDRTHLETWFNQSVTDGALRKINGVSCFVIDPSVSLFSTSDGGPQRALRELLIQRALDPNPEQAIVVVADWEEFAGQKGNPDVPDSYDRVLQWLAQRPWIEVAGLQDLARRGWTATDLGTNQALPTETYAWLRHANEEDYDHWYYGHPLEESLAALRPTLRPGVAHARTIGDVATPGTIFGDTWAAITNAPAGPLKDLAEVAFGSTLYRTAWHAEDNHDLSRFSNGAFVRPDTTFDRLSGFSRALAIRAGEAAITARAARWAANPPSAPTAITEDVDLDGEVEYLLFDDRILLVCEREGGRVVAGFARDPSAAAGTSAGYQVLGDPMAFPSRREEIAHEDELVDAARNSALKDQWATGANRGYVNDDSVAAVSTAGVGLVFTSSDGKLQKRLTWSAPGQIEVTYTLDPSLGTLYVRCGLNPNLAALALSGQRDLVETDVNGVYTLAKTDAGKTVEVRIGYADGTHTARRNPNATSGTPAGARNTAFQHLSEFSGDAPGFRLSLGVGVR